MSGGLADATLLKALPEPALLIDGDRVVDANPALARLLGVALESIDHATLIVESSQWLDERLPVAISSGEQLRIHLRAEDRAVPVDARVGQTPSGTWVLVGRDATSAERVGSVLGRLSSIYAAPGSGNLGSLLRQSQPLFDALGWSVALWRVDGNDAVLDYAWQSERARNHPSGIGAALLREFAEREGRYRIPLTQDRSLQLAVQQGQGSVLEDMASVLLSVFETLDLDVPAVDRELMVEAGFGRGATAPVFLGDRVTHAVYVTGNAIDERDSAGVQLFASMLSTMLRANSLGEEMARQQRHAALGQMSRQLAHEVRNPLAVILHASRQARKPESKAPKEQLLDMIDEEARRLERLMSDLVSFAGPLTLRLQSTPVVDLVRWSLEALTDRERDPVIDVEVDPSLCVWADPMLFRQALSHILANACSHASERVRISAEESEGRVRLLIENDGGPIPDAVAKRVFEPFFSTRATGTGLGLAVVRRLIEDQGGEVQLDRRTDMTVFLVDLPVGRP